MPDRCPLDCRSYIRLNTAIQVLLIVNRKRKHCEVFRLMFPTAWSGFWFGEVWQPRNHTSHHTPSYTDIRLHHFHSKCQKIREWDVSKIKRSHSSWTPSFHPACPSCLLSSQDITHNKHSLTHKPSSHRSDETSSGTFYLVMSKGTSFWYQAIMFKSNQCKKKYIYISFYHKNSANKMASALKEDSHRKRLQRKSIQCI